ncbi:hypothetical protein [Nonlabens ponticola]|uniref:Lipoprotein n=1 Tax=Nonlabens ponticola TaxID=2496866 RepID=A0A3S9MYA0_9FLAO|nr:hypothetical protein [Nonlabens ponticola]AZQ44122.1 hypothetical protein EJ995_07710 [Nonlabens ponticola]
MKKTSFLIISVVCLLITSCDFNNSISKDLNSGAVATGNGLSVEEIEVSVDQENVDKGEFLFGQKTVFKFKDIKGFEMTNGKAFPEMSVAILDEKLDTLDFFDNLLETGEQGTDIEPLELSARFNVVYPMEEDLTAVVEIKDQKSDGTFTYEYPFQVKESEFLNISTDGLSYNHIYLWNQGKQQTVTSDQIVDGRNLVLLFNGLQGFTANNGNVLPAISVKMTDANGNIMIANPNVLSEMGDNEVAESQLSDGIIPVTLSISEGEIANPVRLGVRVKDTKSSKTLEVATTLTIKD